MFLLVKKGEELLVVGALQVHEAKNRKIRAKHNCAGGIIFFFSNNLP